VRPAGRQQDDRLEQAGLAGGIRTMDQVGSRRELELEGVIAPQIGQDKSFEQGIRAATGLGRVSGPRA